MHRWLTSAIVLAATACRFDTTGITAIDGAGGADASSGYDGGPADAVPNATPDAKPNFIGESCASLGAPVVLALNDSLIVSGNTSMANADNTPVSGCNNEPEHRDQVVTVTVLSNGRLAVSLLVTGVTWSPLLEIRSSSCTDPPQTTCNQNFSPLSRTIDVINGQDIFLWVDGGSTGLGVQQGSYMISIALIP